MNKKLNKKNIPNIINYDPTVADVHDRTDYETYHEWIEDLIEYIDQIDLIWSQVPIAETDTQFFNIPKAEDYKMFLIMSGILMDGETPSEYPMGTVRGVHPMFIKKRFTYDSQDYNSSSRILAVWIDRGHTWAGVRSFAVRIDNVMEVSSNELFCCDNPDFSAKNNYWNVPLLVYGIN